MVPTNVHKVIEISYGDVIVGVLYTLNCVLLTKDILVVIFIQLYRHTTSPDAL